MTDRRADAVREMAAKGMSDAEMADALGRGITPQRVYQIRKKHGIPAGRAPGDWKGPLPVAEVPKPVIEPEHVYEENGVTVMRYPARYAENFPQPTARPKR